MGEPVQIVINTCGECPFVDHSGAFTEGGPKPICSHKMASLSFTADKPGVQQGSRDQYHWRHRIVDRNAAPPPECPLRRKGE